MSTMIPYQQIDAEYKPYPGSRFRNNKLVEALPIWSGSKDDLLLDLGHEPRKPDAKTRRLSELIRLDELGTIGDILYGRPAYREAASTILTNLKEAYAWRDITSADDLRRRHQIAAATADQLGSLDHASELSDATKFRLGWRRTAPGYGLFGATGTGKTTLLNALMQTLAVVIRHNITVKGVAVKVVQVPAIRVQVPFDATLRTFCVRFFEQVDFALEQDIYGPQARRHKTIGAMVLELFKVCSAINLGMLIIDDFQNLRAARGQNVVIALNLFSLLMEIAGVALVTAATPAAGVLIESNSRNLRKLTSGGAQVLGMMAPASAELTEFQNVHAPYQYTKHVAKLDDRLRAAWWEASGGNPAFSSLAFTCAQRHAIGGTECLSKAEFEHAMNFEMAPLRPAVLALKSRNPADLQAFEDLIFRKELTTLLETMRVGRAHAPADNTELEDEDLASPSPLPTRRARAKRAATNAQAAGLEGPEASAADPAAASSRPDALPTEDPLSLMARAH